MKFLFLFSNLLLISFVPVFAASHPEFSGIENPSKYILDIDPELTSLLIALESDSDSVFRIDLPNKLINAQNNEFAILVNGFEVEYEIISDANSSTFTFFVPQHTEEIEIIGTHVIPEFSLGAIFGLILMITMIMVASRTKLPIFK